jgi:glycosyltransferase involved in cell wall biosynthesis
MKIIAISSGIPSIGQRGYQVTSFFRLIHLANLGHSIKLVCFGNLKKNKDYKAKRILEKKGIQVHFVQWNILESAWNLLKAIFQSSMPFQCALYRSAKFSKTINQLFESTRADSIYCVMIRIAVNISWFKGKLFVEMVDSMGLNFLRRSYLIKGPKRWIFNIEQKRVSKFEKELADRSKHSFVVSNIDKKKISSIKVNTIPIGIDIKSFDKPRKTKKNPVIIFSGNMFYQPNIDAILWFVKNCWLYILDNEPSAKLYIVGNKPHYKIILLKKKYPSIVITGHVSSMANMLNKATVAIAPMQSGSGMQIKILEAMASSVPVVSTTIGLGDIKAVADKDLLIADEPLDFSQQVFKLLKSKNQNRTLGKNGQKYVSLNHDFNILNKRFSNICGFKKITKNIIRKTR